MHVLSGIGNSSIFVSEYDHIAWKLLWTNNAPNGGMVGQTVPLVQNDCDIYFIKCRVYSGDSTSHIWNVCANNAYTQVSSIGGTSSDFTGNLWCGVRNISVTNHTSMGVGYSHSWGGSSWAQSTAHVYPVEVYGVL